MNFGTAVPYQMNKSIIVSDTGKERFASNYTPYHEDRAWVVTPGVTVATF